MDRSYYLFTDGLGAVRRVVLWCLVLTMACAGRSGFAAEDKPSLPRTIHFICDGGGTKVTRGVSAELDTATTVLISSDLIAATTSKPNQRESSSETRSLFLSRNLPGQRLNSRVL